MLYTVPLLVRAVPLLLHAVPLLVHAVPLLIHAVPLLIHAVPLRPADGQVLLLWTVLISALVGVSPLTEVGDICMEYLRR